MAAPQVVETVHRILVEEFELEPERVTAEAHIVDDLELDSLDAVDLIAALEDAFGGRVDEEEARKVRLVSDIYALTESAIARALAKAEAAEAAPEAAAPPPPSQPEAAAPTPAAEAVE